MTYLKRSKETWCRLNCNRTLCKNRKGRLLRGVDNNKDQTYFLSQVKASEFKDVLFPVGGLTKPEVREIALNAGLPVAEKKTQLEYVLLVKDIIKSSLITI